MANIADKFRQEREEQKTNDTGGIQLWLAQFRPQKETGKSRIRFLVEFTDGFTLKWHKSKNKEFGEWGLDAPCWQDEHFEFDACPYCESDDKATRRNSDLYVWPVWDYETDCVRLYVGKNNPKTLAGKLFDIYEEDGTILGHDFTVKLDGMDYTVLAARKDTPFQFEGKIKVPSEDKLVKSLVLAKDRDLAKEMGYKPEDSIIKPKEQPGGSRAAANEDEKPTPKRTPTRTQQKPTPKAKKQDEEIEGEEVRFEDED